MGLDIYLTEDPSDVAVTEDRWIRWGYLHYENILIACAEFATHKEFDALDCLWFYDTIGRLDLFDTTRAGIVMASIALRMEAEGVRYAEEARILADLLALAFRESKTLSWN